MSTPYIGEIKMFAGNFAPEGWAFCDGQLLSVPQYDALFSLLGTTYGGDGRSTFGLPDMRGRIPVHAGTGPGLSPVNLGAKGGAENITLNLNELPAHNHGPLQADNEPAGTGIPAGHLTAESHAVLYAVNPSGTVPFNNAAVSSLGNNISHNNLMPYQCVNFIIALVGMYPSRT